nr:unnamed protein product [Callosobruchus chinensis]
MVKVVKAVRNKGMGYLKASKVFEVPKGTDERYSKSDKSPEELVRLSIAGLGLGNDLVQYALASSTSNSERHNSFTLDDSSSDESGG